MAWNKTKPFYELAVRIERGVEDIKEVKERGELGAYLQISDHMVETVEEILDRGTCQALEEIEIRLDEVSENLMESLL